VYGTEGVWNRAAEATYSVTPQVVPGDSLGKWSVQTDSLPALNGSSEEFKSGNGVFMYLTGDENENTGNNLHKISGQVVEENGRLSVDWGNINSSDQPKVKDGDVYRSYVSATLTAKAFDSASPGLGKWLVTLASWLFAISTMISWSYYGEQGILYLFNEKAVTPYKIIYCLLIIVATTNIINTTEQLENFSNLGTGVMLWVNIPITLFFGYQAMKAYKNYIKRLKNGKIGDGHDAPALEDLLSGKVD